MFPEEREREKARMCKQWELVATGSVSSMPPPTRPLQAVTCSYHYRNLPQHPPTRALQAVIRSYHHRHHS